MGGGCANPARLEIFFDDLRLAKELLVHELLYAKRSRFSTVSRFLDAAERHGLIDPGRVGDVYQAGVECIRDAPPALEIARVDRAGEAVFGVLATAIAVSSSGTVITAATGPQDSGLEKGAVGGGALPAEDDRAPPATDRLT
jgi:hypothetical protein